MTYFRAIYGQRIYVRVMQGREERKDGQTIRMPSITTLHPSEVPGIKFSFFSTHTTNFTEMYLDWDLCFLWLAHNS
jgi:hypothetical protein